MQEWCLWAILVETIDVWFAVDCISTKFILLTARVGFMGEVAPKTFAAPSKSLVTLWLVPVSVMLFVGSSALA